MLPSRPIRQDLAVVIATLDRDDMLQSTLRQLADQPTLPGRVIVVDQGAPADKSSMLAPLTEAGVQGEFVFSRYRSISAARNVGLEHAGSASLILYLDDDVELESDVVAEHARYYDEEPGTAVVAGHVTCPPTSPEWDRLNTFRPEGDWLRQTRGCHMSFRASALREVGGFNAYICNNGDETELCRRLNKAGYHIRNGRRAVVRHLVSPSGGNRQVAWKSSANYARVLRDGIIRCVKDRGWLAGGAWPIKNVRIIQGIVSASPSIPQGIWAAGQELIRAYRLARLSRTRHDYIPLSLQFASGVGVDPKTGLPCV